MEVRKVKKQETGGEQVFTSWCSGWFSEMTPVSRLAAVVVSIYIIYIGIDSAGRLVYLRGIFFFNLICFDVAVSTVWTKTRKHYMYTVYAYLICIVLSFGTFCNVFLNHSFFDFFSHVQSFFLETFLSFLCILPFLSFPLLAFPSFPTQSRKQNGKPIIYKVARKWQSWQNMTKKTLPENWQTSDRKWQGFKEMTKDDKDMTKNDIVRKKRKTAKTWLGFRKRHKNLKQI